MSKTTEQSDGWNNLTRAYKDSPTIENYVALRRRHPDEKIEVAVSAGLEWLFDAQAKLRQFGIEPDLVASALDADRAAISELSLQLLELIIERQKATKAGGTHLVSRDLAISDDLVNFLINLMLDALDWNNRLIIPRDLIVLIRHQTGGGQDAEFERQETLERQKTQVSVAMIELLLGGQPLTIRAISKKMGVNPSTVMRWYPDGTLATNLADLTATAADIKGMKIRS